MQNMGKNIKVMPQPKSIPREREESLTANNPNLSATNVIRLNCTHSFFKFTTKFFNLVLDFGKIPVN